MFGPHVEADAYRIYLYMSAFPDHGVVRTVLQADDGASISFAKFWLHEAQPRPLIGGDLFDAWRVERFTERHSYVVVAEGLAERRCRVRPNQKRTLREWHDERSGASDIRNGIDALYPEATKGDSKRRRVVAGPKPTRRRKPRAALTPFQQKIQELRDEAKKRVKELPPQPISETRQQWRDFISGARSNRARNGAV